jgi:hypothetical protein
VDEIEGSGESLKANGNLARLKEIVESSRRYSENSKTPCIGWAALGVPGGGGCVVNVLDRAGIKVSDNHYEPNYVIGLAGHGDEEYLLVYNGTLFADFSGDIRKFVKGAVLRARESGVLRVWTEEDSCDIISIKIPLNTADGTVAEFTPSVASR